MSVDRRKAINKPSRFRFVVFLEGGLYCCEGHTTGYVELEWAINGAKGALRDVLHEARRKNTTLMPSFGNIQKVLRVYLFNRTYLTVAVPSDATAVDVVENLIPKIKVKGLPTQNLSLYCVENDVGTCEAQKCRFDHACSSLLL
jgi:hypothetical protein